MNRSRLAFSATLFFSLSVGSALAYQRQEQPGSGSAGASSSYQAKFAGDPARSDSEAAALGYIRVVIGAERAYKKKHGQYASSLQALVGHGSFTKRMTSPTRGDYKVRFKGTADSFSVWMDALPQPGPAHRSFFADERGTIRADENNHAGPESPPARR